jgi:ubiquinone/menaquinone biosynthesis C-methylase UbiE
MSQLNKSYLDGRHEADSDRQIMPRLYIALRDKENRLASDEELLKLPEVERGHMHFKEWEIRKRSCEHLLHYVSKKNHLLRILEIGCGNGWLSNRLSDLPHTEVTGLDINTLELDQANKVFAGKKNLRFVHGDIRHGVLGDNHFDLIVFAASIQYFPSLIEIISKAKRLLKTGGEIYITDSMFYDQQDIKHAKARSASYFDSIGFPEMSSWYFHHSITALDCFNYKILYQPGNFISKFFKSYDPFYRILIKSGSL